MANGYNISISTPVGQSSSGPIPIRLANSVPVCGTMQHWVGQSTIVLIPMRLANRVVPHNTGLANVVVICGPIQHRLANHSLSPSQSGWPMRYLFTYLWSHATPVGQSIIVPIPIRLANGVPICGPMQHRLASQSLSPSQSGWPTGYLFVVPCNTSWPMGYLFVVPYNTGWPINHCPHLNQIGQ
jgi:hypothetical protein